MRSGHLCFYLLCLAVTFSCQDQPDEVLPPTDNKISYVSSYGGWSGWVVFSDDEGEVLNLQQMTGANTIHFEGFQGSTINMTVMIRQPDSWFIKTYIGVTPGNYETAPLLYYLDEVVGHHFLRIPELYTYSSVYLLGSDKLSWIQYDFANNTLDLNLFDSAGFLYTAWVPGGFEPRYMIKPIRVGEETIFTTNQFEEMTPMSRIPLVLAKPANVDVYLGGKTISGKEIPLCHEYFGSNSTGYVSFPGELDLFASFYQRINYSIPGSSIWFEHSVEGPTLQSEFTPLPINLDGLNEKDYPILDFEATGSCDYFEASINKALPNSFISWAVYGEFKGDTRLVLPRFTSKMRNTMQFNVDDLTFSTLRFIENGNVTGYSDWYPSFIRNDYETSRNINSKQFFLGN
jgi:hypothetical protein